MNQSNNSVNLEYHQILTKILLWIAAGWYAFNGMRQCEQNDGQLYPRPCLYCFGAVFILGT